MIPIEELFKKNEGDWSGFDPYPEYKSLLESTGVVVVAEEMVGDYQGDYLYLVRGDKGWGFVVQGYGSCSGCDALEAATSLKDLDNIRQEMSRSTHWEKTKADMLGYFEQGKAAPQNWYWSDQGGKKAMAKIMEKLR